MLIIAVASDRERAAWSGLCGPTASPRSRPDRRGHGDRSPATFRRTVQGTMTCGVASSPAVQGYGFPMTEDGMARQEDPTAGLSPEAMGARPGPGSVLMKVLSAFL